MSTTPGQQPPPPQRPAGPPPAKKKSTVSVGQILAGVLFVLVIVFIIENSQQVRIRFIVGPKVEVPVFVALLIAAVVGALISSLMRFRRQHKNSSDRSTK